jgi:two-component system, OmpR family, response regulator
MESKAAGAPAAHMRVLVVEDDTRVRDELEHGLAADGFAVVVASDRASAESLLEAGSITLVVLDLGLPDGHGFDLLKHLPPRSPPVIVLTARTDVSTRVRAFKLGAADYLAKPFFMAELAARIRARLAPLETALRRVLFANVVVDLDARVVTIDGAASDLTCAELDILAHLVSRPGRAVSRSVLAELSPDSSSSRLDRTVDSHVSRLRAKLGPKGRDHIQTVWGIGWRFDP